MQPSRLYLNHDRYVLEPNWVALVKPGGEGWQFCSLTLHYAACTPAKNGIDEGEGEDHVICKRRFEIIQRLDEAQSHATFLVC